MLTKKHRNFFSKVFVITTMVVSLCLMFSLADLFSSLITVGGFSFVGDEISIPQYTLYAVCTSGYQTKIQADEDAVQIQMQGGAGYVWTSGNEYTLIASVYENESDAKKVLTQISDIKPNASVKEIHRDSISLNNNAGSAEKEVLTEALETFKTTYKKLYDIAVSLDTSVIKEINARLAINELYSNINKMVNNYKTLFGNNDSSSLAAINNSLLSLDGIMQKLVEDNYNPYTSKIKLAYTQNIFEYKKLAEKLS